MAITAGLKGYKSWLNTKIIATEQSSMGHVFSFLAHPGDVSPGEVKPCSLRKHIIGGGFVADIVVDIILICRKHHPIVDLLLSSSLLCYQVGCLTGVDLV